MLKLKSELDLRDFSLLLGNTYDFMLLIEPASWSFNSFRSISVLLAQKADQLLLATDPKWETPQELLSFMRMEEALGCPRDSRTSLVRDSSVWQVRDEEEEFGYMDPSGMFLPLRLVHSELLELLAVYKPRIEQLAR